MSLRTPSKDRRCPRLLCRGAKERHLLRNAACGWLLSVCLSVKPVGKPNAEIGTFGLMSGDGKRGVGHRPQATAPILDSTQGRPWCVGLGVSKFMEYVRRRRLRQGATHMRPS